MRDSKEYVIFDSVTPQTLTSSTNASPSVVTKVGHGLATGDRVLIFGHATNTAINGIFDVVRVDADTFTLKDINTGAAIAGNGVGANGWVMTAPKIVLCSDFRNAILHFNTAGTATLTVKLAGSLGKNRADQSTHGDTPNFGATQSDTNPYAYLAAVNLEDGAVVEGDTGIAVAGTDLYRQYEANVNAIKYLTLIPSTWTQGAITAKIMVFNND